MLKGSKNENYKINPLKRELRALYQEFYSKGYTSYKILKKSIIDHQRLLDIYNKINAEYNKKFVLDDKQYSIHYRQYGYMQKYKKNGKKNTKEKKIKKKDVLNKIEQTNQKVIIQENKNEINKQEIEIKKNEKLLDRMTKEELFVAAQNGFLTAFQEKDFYNKITTNILNISDIIYNTVYNNLANGTTEKKDQEFITNLINNFTELLKSIEFGKLAQLQPQAINVIKQDNQQINNFPDFSELSNALKLANNTNLDN